MSISGGKWQLKTTKYWSGNLKWTAGFQLALVLFQCWANTAITNLFNRLNFETDLFIYLLIVSHFLSSLVCILTDVFIRFQSAKVSSRPRPTSSLPPRSEEIDENNGSGSENKHLSAWEQWVLRKAIEERDRLESELENQRREHEKAERERDEKEKKKAKGAEVIQAWIEEHDSVIKQRLQLAAQRRRAEKELKETKKKTVKAEAEVKYKVLFQVFTLVTLYRGSIYIQCFVSLSRSGTGCGLLDWLIDWLVGWLVYYGMLFELGVSLLWRVSLQFIFNVILLSWQLLIGSPRILLSFCHGLPPLWMTFVLHLPIN